MSNRSKKTESAYQCDIVVAGAGPAGLMAAIMAAREGAHVIVLERNDKPLKKLYATGNGRCNFSNINMEPGVYRGSDPGYAMKIVDYYDRNDLLLFFHNLGMMTKHIGDYIYPYNEQARTVADALLLECRRLDIGIFCGETVVDITQAVSSDDPAEKNDGSEIEEVNITSKAANFTVTTHTHKYRCRRVIAATGGKASPAHGSDGNLNGVLTSLGLTMVRQRPALVPLTFEGKKLSKLAGVRVKCAVRLTIDDLDASEECGEIIFNKDNISGIPVMQMSRYATGAFPQGRMVTVHINLFPDETDGELKELLYRAFKGVYDPDRRSDFRKDRKAKEALSLCLNEKLAEYCLLEAGIIPGSLAGNVPDRQLEKLADILKDLRIAVTGDAGYERAQVTAGGFAVSELTDDLESRKVKGLYIIGELCDVDGTCGGYNLQWAFSSGAVAGRSASCLT